MKPTHIALLTVLTLNVALLCRSQEPVPTIRLSAAEAAEARQSLETLNNALTRRDKAKTEWTSFYQTYQANHPQLPGLRFSSDFQMAFVIRNSSDHSGEVSVMQLTKEEQRQAVKLHQEGLNSEEAVKQASKLWNDYQHELTANHIPFTGSGISATLRNGKTVVLPCPWCNGLAFTPDFLIAVPRF